MAVARTETTTVNREVKLLNLICVLAALFFVAMAVLNALLSPELLSTDSLFVTMVCMVMALMFAVNPLLYLKSEGKLPIPFQKRLPRRTAAELPGTAPPLLDAKGRAVPPDVRSMVANMKQKQP